jgi:hypothetical protein
MQGKVGYASLELPHHSCYLLLKLGGMACINYIDRSVPLGPLYMQTHSLVFVYLYLLFD